VHVLYLKRDVENSIYYIIYTIMLFYTFSYTFRGPNVHFTAGEIDFEMKKTITKGVGRGAGIGFGFAISFDLNSLQYVFTVVV